MVNADSRLPQSDLPLSEDVRRLWAARTRLKENEKNVIPLLSLFRCWVGMCRCVVADVSDVLKHLRQNTSQVSFPSSLTLLAAAVSYWAINPGFWSCVQPWGILPAREKLAWDPWDKEGFLCCQSLAVWHHSLSNFVQHHRWKQLAEERIRRSDLASDDSQAFRKSWQDGETARRQAAMKHAGHMSHMYYMGHMTWIRIHEITWSRACVFRCHSRSQRPVWSDLLGCLALQMLFPAFSCSVSLRCLEILEPRCEYRTASTAACPCLGKVLIFWESIRVHQSPWELMKWESKSSDMQDSRRFRCVSIIVIFGWQHTLWYTLWSFVKWICFKMLQISSCQDESWGASSGWATSKDWWWCSFAASYKRFRRYMKISNL